MTGMEEEIAKQLVRPIYEDALKPFSQEISKGLLGIARSINSGIFLVEDCVNATVGVLRLTAEQLAIIPPDRIDFSRPRVALQALDQAKFTVNEEEVQKLFSNLIASSLDSENRGAAHPAYIEVIKQLQSDEALILKEMVFGDGLRSGAAPTIDIVAKKSGGGLSIQSTIHEINLVAEDAGCISPENSNIYFENLKRIGLISHSSGTSFPQEKHRRIFDSDKSKEICLKTIGDAKISYLSGSYVLTAFGRGFARCCIKSNM